MYVDEGDHLRSAHEADIRDAWGFPDADGLSHEGILCVEKAGEILYKYGDDTGGWRVLGVRGGVSVGEKLPRAEAQGSRDRRELPVCECVSVGENVSRVAAASHTLTLTPTRQSAGGKHGSVQYDVSRRQNQ